MDQARSLSPRSLDILKFPEDLDKVPHKMLINIRSYRRSGAGTLSIPTGTDTRSAVALPVPSKIEESYNAQYSETDLGIIGNALSNAVDGFMSGEQIGSTLRRVGSDLTGQADDIRNNRPIRTGLLNIGQAALYQGAIAATSTAASAIGLNIPARQAIAAGTGVIFNPHTTAIFSGVKLRNFSYSWTLAPKTEKESRSIEQIVRVLRNAMLPARGVNELFLKFPDQIEYKILGAMPDFDMPTTPCVITGINLDRTKSGPAFFAKTGAPVVYGLNISLMEIRALTRDDFTESATPPNTPNNSVPTPAPTQRNQLASGTGE